MQKCLWTIWGVSCNKWSCQYLSQIAWKECKCSNSTKMLLENQLCCDIVWERCTWNASCSFMFFVYIFIHICASICRSGTKDFESWISTTWTIPLKCNNNLPFLLVVLHKPIQLKKYLLIEIFQDKQLKYHCKYQCSNFGNWRCDSTVDDTGKNDEWSSGSTEGEYQSWNGIGGGKGCGCQGNSPHRCPGGWQEVDWIQDGGNEAGKIGWRVGESICAVSNALFIKISSIYLFILLGGFFGGGWRDISPVVSVLY